MGEFLKRLFDSDFMPHGACWRWEPWVLWSNALSDIVIAVCLILTSLALIHVAIKRKDVPFDGVVVMFGVFTLACACAHALDAYNAWHGVFRLAGAVKVITAGASLILVVLFLRIVPKLMVMPSLNHAIVLDAALSSEKRERDRMEGRLKESQDRFRVLLAAIKDYAIVLLDPEGRVTSWNPGAARLKGYSEEEILGSSILRFFPQEDVAAGKPQELLRLAAVNGRIEDEGWAVRKDGSRFLANTILTALYDSQGGLQGFANVTRDITAQSLAQAALQSQADDLEDKVKAQVQELWESEARLQGFIRHASAAIAFKGVDGRFLLINPRREALIGRPSQEILGRTNEELFSPEVCAKVAESDRRVLALREESTREEEWTREDGARHHYLVHKFPMVDGNGRCWGLGLIATDITERRQGELVLLQGQKLESLGVLVGGIAHDFNNLLGAMQGNVELALMEPSLVRARPHLETLRGLMAKASDLLRHMLAYAGQGKSSTITLDLNHLVEDMTQLLRTSISKKASIRLDLCPEGLPMQADASQIEQVIMNLVINASEALAEQSGNITIQTRLEELSQGTIELFYGGQMLRPGRYVCLEVADDGVGMTPEVQKRIFDPFFTTKFTGRGLGLAALHGIVRSHRGGLRVVSAAGAGSTFQLLFPLATAAAVPLARHGLPPHQASLPRFESGPVLVVDDEDQMRAVVVKALERAGFQTFQAREGLEALRACEQHPGICLILMDLTMPHMDGEEACRELARRGVRAPIILSSGFNEADALNKFEDLKLAGFIQKPFSLVALVELIRKVLSDLEPG